MNEFEGTPATWGIYTTDDGKRIYVVDESDLTICSFDTVFSPEINQANANLVRTAPELYSVLKGFLEVYESNKGYELMKLYKEKAHDILAKARGE